MAAPVLLGLRLGHFVLYCSYIYSFLFYVSSFQLGTAYNCQFSTGELFVFLFTRHAS